MRISHAEESLAIGVGLGHDDVLAAHEDGHPTRPEYLRAEWRRLCLRAEVPQMSDLTMCSGRHAQVTLLRAAGLPDGVVAPGSATRPSCVTPTGCRTHPSSRPPRR